MTNKEVKFLLQAYRSNRLDASDPALAEALARAQSDPELAAWLEHEQAHTGAVAAKVAEIQPPPGLRETILAGMHAEPAARPRGAAWRHSFWLGLAACFVVLLGLAAWWRLTPVPGVTLEEYAVNFVDRGFLLQERSPDVTRLKAWLEERGTPLPGRLPAEFARLRALGCRTLAFEGRDVSLICFERDGKEYHVFVARRADLPANGPAAPPLGPNLQLREHRGHVVTSWSDPENEYVLVSDGALEEVRRVL